MAIEDQVEHEALVRSIRSEIWPGIMRIFQGTELVPDTASDDDRPTIDIEPGPETAVSFLFLVTSEEDPWSEDGRTLYFCRMTVTCRPCSFNLGTDFFVYFPETMDINHLRPLLGSPVFSGNPPSLVIESGHGDLPGVLVVGFRHSRGHGYPGNLPVQTMLADIAERINYLRRAIRAVHVLSEDFNSDSQLERLVRELEKCFPCC